MARIPFTGLEGMAQPGTIQIPDDYQRMRPDPEAFGAGIGQAGQQFGRGLEAVGGELQRAAIVQRNFENQVATTAKLNELQSGQRQTLYGRDGDPNDTGYLGLSGKNAVDSYQPTVKSIEDQRAQLMAGIQDPIQRQMFDMQSRRLTDATLDRVGGRRQQQMLQWGVQTQRAAASNSMADALSNFDDDGKFNNYLADTLRLQQQADQTAGASPEVMRANQMGLVNGAWKDRIMRVAAGDPLAADAMLRNNLSKLDAQTQTQMLERMKPLVQRTQIDNVFAELTGRSNGQSGSASPAFLARLIGTESGGRANAQNPQSSARGLGQFIDSTWLDVTKRFAPEAVAGKSQAEVLAMRDDPALSQRMTEAYTAENANRLQAAGIQATPATLYSAYALGPDGAIKLAGADPSASAASVLGAQTVAVNPQYQGRTVAQVRQWFEKKMAGVDQSAQPASQPYQIPSREQLLQQVEDATRGMPLAVQDGVRSKMLAYRSQQDARLSGDRSAFGKEFGNTTAALADGRDVLPVEETRIRALFPPEQAEPLIEQQRIAQATGNVSRAVAFASVDELNQMRQDVSSGVGPISRVLLGRGQNAVPVDGGQAAAPVDGQGADSTENYRLRRQAAQVLEQRIAARQQALTADPASYAMQNPALASVLQAASGANAAPEQRAAAVSAVLAEQERLGVPEGKRMAMPMAQAQADVATLSKVDPAKADMGLELSRKASAYGDAWPQVFGSYVRAGLSREYQALAIMDRPEQTADRADFQRGLMVQSERGGLAKLREAVGTAAAKQIDDGIDEQLADFRASTIYDRDAVRLFDTMRDSVKTLAYYKAIKGDSNALADAVDGIIGKRYDFEGSMRVPKGMLPDVRAATRQAVADLKPEDMPVLASSTENLAPADAQNQLLASIRSRGMWVPTADDNGLQLTVLGNGNTPIAVTKAGKPLILRFDRVKPRGGGPSPLENRSDPTAGLAG